MRHLIPAIILLCGATSIRGDDLSPDNTAAYRTTTTPVATYGAATPLATPIAQGSAQTPYQPPPGGRLMADAVGVSARPGVYDAEAAAANEMVAPALATNPSLDSPVEPRLIESTWYYRIDSYSWNERLDGADFVNENGPLSTIGYMRRSGAERFRFELFGGTVAYDGYAQYNNGALEAYYLANGTDYLGLRGEYDLLIEPSSWNRFRLVLGVGTRFWIRDLHDAVTPSGGAVSGYQETWWTFYPYLGIETKAFDETVLHWFGSARIGFTPLTYEHVSLIDFYGGTAGTVLYPRCGVTAQGELGIAYRRLTASVFAEVMTWDASAVVRDLMQPTSSMVTIGGKVSYTF